MKSFTKSFASIIAITICIIVLPAFFSDPLIVDQKVAFPYKKAGLTEREAAAHLLNRFTYGTSPGQVDAVVKIGLEKWFLQQLSGKLNDDSLNSIIADFDVTKLSNAEIVDKYPKGAQVRRMAIKDGIIDKDSISTGDKKEYRDQLTAYMQKNGMKPQQELFRQLVNQKILRAAYSNNQLQELLTDFWFNHFNVSITKKIAQNLFLLTKEM